MKTPTFETWVVSAKLFCVFAGTSLLTLQTGLGQWSNVETNPTIIQWVMILGGSLGTGLTATGAFLSNAFGKYADGQVPPVVPPPLVAKTLLTEAKKPDTLVPE